MRIHIDTITENDIELLCKLSPELLKTSKLRSLHRRSFHYQKTYLKKSKKTMISKNMFTPLTTEGM